MGRKTENSSKKNRPNHLAVIEEWAFSRRRVPGYVDDHGLQEMDALMVVDIARHEILELEPVSVKTGPQAAVEIIQTALRVHKKSGKARKFRVRVDRAELAEVLQNAAIEGIEVVVGESAELEHAFSSLQKHFEEGVGAHDYVAPPPSEQASAGHKVYIKNEGTDHAYYDEGTGSSLDDAGRLLRMRERREEYEEYFRAVFLATYQSQGASEKWLEAAYLFLGELLRWQRMRGTTIGYTFEGAADPPVEKSWSAQVVEDFMLRHMPAAVFIPDLPPEDMPAILTGFLRMLARRGAFDTSRSMKAITARPAKVGSRMIKRLADTKLYSPRKQTLLRLHAAGVDIAEPQDVFDYLQKEHQLADDAATYQADSWPLKFDLRLHVNHWGNHDYHKLQIPSDKTYTDIHAHLAELTGFDRDTLWECHVRDLPSGAEVVVRTQRPQWGEFPFIESGDLPIWNNLPFVGARVYWRIPGENLKCSIELMKISE